MSSKRTVFLEPTRMGWETNSNGNPPMMSSSSTGYLMGNTYPTSERSSSYQRSNMVSFNSDEGLALVKYGSMASERTAPMTDDEGSPDPSMTAWDDSTDRVKNNNLSSSKVGYRSMDVDDDEDDDLEQPAVSPDVSKLSEQEGLLYLGRETYYVKRMAKGGSKTYDRDSPQDDKNFFFHSMQSENEELKTKLAFLKRFQTTLDTIISKLFPAGFCWQLAAVLCGYEYTTFGYALSTGIGEALGVILGHILYCLAKNKFDWQETIQTAIFLGTGTICSGTSWQPVVNTLQGMGLSFMGVFVGTWIACTYMFNFGLRVARNLYSETMVHVEGPTWENSRSDFLLSLTIGGATAFFVGTDVEYRPDENFLGGLVGVPDDLSAIHGAVLSGCSTALGFGVTQVLFNLVFPAGKCWLD